MVDNLAGGAAFHDFALIDDRDAVAEEASRSQVVGDEQKGHVFVFLDFGQELEDGERDAGIEHGRWFIRDHKFRLQNHGPGDGRPLALSSAELVWIALQEVPGRSQTGRFQGLSDALLSVLWTSELMDDQGLGNGVENREIGIQGLVRVLGDQLDLAPEWPVGCSAESRTLLVSCVFI